MHKSILQLEPCRSAGPNTYRTVFKTRHGRIVFLALVMEEPACSILDCFYIDRSHKRTTGGRYNNKPMKLRTLSFPITELLSVIGSELDKQFYGIEFIRTDTEELSAEAYIQLWKSKHDTKYRFLIMVGSGETYNGLPLLLRTRLKNKLHRSVYLKLAYYKDGKGVVKQCCYYDRKYKHPETQVVPPMLISCFFPYTHEGILSLINREICCDFTHMLVTDGIDPDTNPTPLCGSL